MRTNASKTNICNRIYQPTRNKSIYTDIRLYDHVALRPSQCYDMPVPWPVIQASVAPCSVVVILPWCCHCRGLDSSWHSKLNTPALLVFILKTDPGGQYCCHTSPLEHSSMKYAWGAVPFVVACWTGRDFAKLPRCSLDLRAVNRLNTCSSNRWNSTGHLTDNRKSVPGWISYFIKGAFHTNFKMTNLKFLILLYIPASPSF